MILNYTMDHLLQQFKAYIKAQQLFNADDKLLLAVSGGADSAVLCALCAAAGLKFAVAHCNFQLRGAESDRDETFVRSLGNKYKVQLFVKQFDTIAVSVHKKKGIEETARDLRYDWFAELLKTDPSFKFLLTAHHADDNTETVLMNFFRGTGIKGLRGIKPKNGNIVRPFLFASSTMIREYASTNNIAFVNDSTNENSDYTRNFFRNELIPQIEKVFPNVKRNIAANIERFADLEYAYKESMETAKLKLIQKKGNDTHIPVLKLKKTKPLRSVIHEIISDYGFTAAQISETEKLLEADSGKYILSATHRILKNRNWLIISPLAFAVNETEFYLIEKSTAKISFSGGELNIQLAEKPAELDSGNNLVYIHAADLKYPLLLRKWKQGDYFYPLGMKKKKKISRFFSDQKLSLLQKENVWLIESDKKIVWIIGQRIDDRFRVTEGSSDILKLSLVCGDQ